ncbi:DUF6773 family protein [Bacillus sp. FSL R9-9481]|uniref:DUF6773 family protein n=1 Tax=Bacillus sp. FSL R9-9481 TaxID=2921591 RepID=UPI0030F4B91B
MDKLKNWFSLSTHSDERIQQIEMKIWAQSGIVVLLLAFVDLIIRGLYLQRPFLEWAATLGIIICYTLFFLIRSILAGVYETEIDNKEQLNTKLKNKMFNTSIFCFVAIAITTYRNQLPETTIEWLLIIFKFIIVFTLLFGIQYIITKFTWYKNNKN